MRGSGAVFLSLWLAPVLFACRGGDGRPLVSPSQTFAELRTIKRGVTVVPPGRDAREPYPRERLVDGQAVRLASGGLAWLRRDGGVTLLVAGPAALTLRADALELGEGKLFVDTPPGSTTELKTPRGMLHLSAVRTSLELEKGGALRAYVLRGAVRTDGGKQAGPGEELTLAADGKATTRPVATWQDWTGGLATTDRAAEPAPFGIGTVGARKPGEQGQPRFPLSIQRLDVRVTIDQDFATTEVDEVFANPSSDTVEGIYTFRTPEGATLHRFGVDRKDTLVWGRVKEKGAAAAQYQANVYEGSTEDPALLEWVSPGLYKARLYPIRPRETRRVVTRYAQWLGRHGPRGERRLYVYPMAAEGTEGTLPRIEELTVTLDIARAGAREVRVGMSGKQVGSQVVVKAYDLVPRADLAVELYDSGVSGATAYRADHVVDKDTTPADELEKTKKLARGENPYVLVPVRPGGTSEPAGGLDLAVVVDTSAATAPASLAIARAATGALLAHLGPADRAAVWAGDAVMRAVSPGSDRFAAMDPQRRDGIVKGLAGVERGGATDLGAIVADTASKLDANRRGAVVYVGDGVPTVGELGMAELAKRLDRLPRPVRLFAIAIGDHANLPLLSGMARGGFSSLVEDAHAAAETALRVLEAAERPVWLGASVDLGPGVDRVYPRDLGALGANETAIVVGRVVGALPKEIVLRASGNETRQSLVSRELADDGDLERRWAEGRLAQLLDDGAGRAAVVEVGIRAGIITPFTSLYVPTAAERERELGQADERQASGDHWWNWLFSKKNRGGPAPEAVASASADDKEGGTGTRAKGEEGSMGNPMAKASGKRYAVGGPRDNAEPQAARAAALSEAKDFGMTGLLSTGAGVAPAATAAGFPPLADAEPAEKPAAAPPAAFALEAPARKKADMPTSAGDAGGLRLGAGGGGRGEGIGLAALGAVGHGAGTGTGQGFGSGRGRLGGEKKTRPPSVRVGKATVTGRLAPEVVQRIVRQKLASYRVCYEQGLGRNPNLEGRVNVRIEVGGDGAVAGAKNIGSDLPDAAVVACVVGVNRSSSFPAPDGGTATVDVPILLSPEQSPAETRRAAAEAAEDAKQARKQEQAASAAHPKLASIGHAPKPCAASADLPLEERRILWRERLGRAGTEVQAVANVYAGALRDCEMQTWGERAQLLALGVDTVKGVRGRVDLWRVFLQSPAAADVIYHAILTRIHTAADIRELHDALGVKRIEPTVLAQALSKQKTPTDRVHLLRGLVAKWPDDLELALVLLDACEDAGDESTGRALARTLRRRSDATTRVRTAVGEYYLRLSERASGAGRDRDLTEARRTFGEIVEFAPEDPGARRLLGDLLRAHGWYDEAFRQYETLARLVPDDKSVPLLLAAAAQGVGRTEEAIRWTEKATGAGPPDPTNADARTARAFASAFLAWAREEAVRQGRKDEAARLRERARRLTAVDVSQPGTVRIILTWSHPELHPELWSSALGSPMPVSDGDPALGVAQALLPLSTGNVAVEVHLGPADAERAGRLGAQAVLTAILDEGTDKEKLVRLPLVFARTQGEASVKRSFRFDGSALHEESS
jgi:tetratricopeptide (TPR) repeat protein